MSKSNIDPNSIESKEFKDFITKTQEFGSMLPLPCYPPLFMSQENYDKFNKLYENINKEMGVPSKFLGSKKDVKP